MIFVHRITLPAPPYVHNFSWHRGHGPFITSTPDHAWNDWKADRARYRLHGEVDPRLPQSSRASWSTMMVLTDEDFDETWKIATGRELDDIGARHGVMRKRTESDDTFRRRVGAAAP